MKKSRKGYFVKAIKNPKNAVYVVRTNLDIIIGRMLFKNTAGLMNNLEGKKTESKIKKKLINAQNPDSTVIHFRDNGLTNLGSPFNDLLIKEIADKYNKMIEDDKFSIIRSQYEGKVYSRMINRPHRLFPELKNLITPNLIKMIEQYYKIHFQIVDVTMWRTYHVPSEVTSKKEIFGNNWHCDGDNTTITTIFVNLTDVTEKDGPLHLVPSERTKELIKMGYKTRHNYNIPMEILEDQKYVLEHVGSKGSSIWVNTQHCLHRAGIPEEGRYRDMLQFRFIPSEKPLSSDWLEKCRENNLEINYNAIKNSS